MHCNAVMDYHKKQVTPEKYEKGKWFTKLEA